MLTTSTVNNVYSYCCCVECSPEITVDSSDAVDLLVETHNSASSSAVTDNAAVRYVLVTLSSERYVANTSLLRSLFRLFVCL